MSNADHNETEKLWPRLYALNRNIGKVPKIMKAILRSILIGFTLLTSAPAYANDFLDYTFSPAPLVGNNAWLIRNFGPVGIGIMLESGPVMKINNVETGSPAGMTGALAQGDIIESINGLTLAGTERDPRLFLADIITQAEASDGRINLQIKDKGLVTVEIPVLGQYSDTWPLNCPKSDAIVRTLADLLAEQGDTGWGSVLFLLSTGEQKDLDVVQGWMQERAEIGPHNWAIGIQGIGICEYYLRTGDATVLPMIQQGADHLRDTIYNGAWSGRGASIHYQTGGHMNAAGVHCLTFLLLAKTCGVDVDEQTLQIALGHFFRYAGQGSVPYGDHTPRPGYGDCNGKTGGLALAMAAAARLTPDGASSVYAEAAQISAMKAYYGTHVYHMGHTGGGIGELWKSAGMQLMADARPAQHREYTDARRWSLELARRHNGAIGMAGGPESNYDQAAGETAIAWGTFNALNYTAPRGHLHIFGAPLSPWAQSHQLPALPARASPGDADFCSPFPVPGGSWTNEDIFMETLHEHGGAAVTQKLSGNEVSDETILKYLHHPEITHRDEARHAMQRLQRDDILLDLLRSDDARLRHMGIMAVHYLMGTWRNSSNQEKNRVTTAMWDEIDQIIRDPEESNNNRRWATRLLMHVDLASLRTYRDLLADHAVNGPNQNVAVDISMRLLTDPESYQIMFPPIMQAIHAGTSFPLAVSSGHNLYNAMLAASPEIQAYGLEHLKDLYEAHPRELRDSQTGIYVIPSGASAKRGALAKALSFSEEGAEFVMQQPMETLQSFISGEQSDMYVFDGEFQIDPAYLGEWSWAIWPAADHPDEVEYRITNWIQHRMNQFGEVVPDEQPKDWVVLVDDGTVRSRSYYAGNNAGPHYWSGNMLFGVSRAHAYQIEIRNVDGYDFLLIERGFERGLELDDEGIAPPIPPDHHPGFHIYLRKK